MKSMTGFGQGKAQNTEISIDVSLRTVNGRFLEPRFHLPREYMQFESDLRQLLAKKVARGTIDIFVSRKNRVLGQSSKVIVNKDLAKKYVEAYRMLGKELQLDGRVGVELLTRWPELVKLEDSGEAHRSEKALLEKAFASALDGCLKERTREGKSLCSALKKILQKLEEKVAVLQQHRKDANASLQARLEEKLSARLKGGIDPDRLAQEVVMQIDKSDINEELQRLEEHFRHYRKILGRGQAEGKKLDFYTQELLREVNTIGSKTQMAVMTEAVVEAKSLVENLREQVQNIE